MCHMCHNFADEPKKDFMFVHHTGIAVKVQGTNKRDAVKALAMVMGKKRGWSSDESDYAQDVKEGNWWTVKLIG